MFFLCVFLLFSFFNKNNVENRPRLVNLSFYQIKKEIMSEQTNI